ncbi:DUF5017 domain-containing protein [Pedobacter arcticus]|uniref:DUF5017 domain-containing protein n=1 Tax=Pedobacter arcticus TaxID=752140 RepID=UPI0003141569|nr:DUF5017 domain-containing protein [Pedobacter arcticus]
MKNLIKKYTIILGLIALISSCNKAADDIEKEEVDTEVPTTPEPLAFNAQIDQNLTFKVGDTVKFNLEGNSDLVGFYSGAVGNNYEFRNKERFYEVLAKLSFDSNKTPANSTNVDCASLLYSTDFNGVYDYTNVKSATWLPITSRFNLQDVLQATSTTYAQSGSVDISDLFTASKPVYLAWLCKTAAGSSRTQFRVQNFKLQGVVVDKSSLSSDLYTQMQFDFKWVLNPDAAAQTGSNLPSITSTQVVWTGVFNNTTGPYKDGYAVTKAIVLPQFNAGKDTPTILLPKWKESISDYKYVYSKAGTYEAVFLASNLNSGAPGEIVKKVNITIAP